MNNKSTLNGEKYCVYCNQYKPDHQFSDEHIWPRSLGGNQMPSIWRIEVCIRCNSISGLFVDGAFSRSFLIRNQRNDFDFKFLGQLKEHNLGADLEVDVYFGITVKVFHIREVESEIIWQQQVGGDPRNRNSKKHFSKVFVSVPKESMPVNAENDENLSRVLKKVQKTFGRARFFSNYTSDKFPQIEKFNINSIEQRDILTFLKNLGDNLSLTFSMQEDFQSRFLSKLCLSLGLNLLGEKFFEFDYFEQLRAHFKEANSVKRNEISVKHTSYFRELHFSKYFDTDKKWLLSILNLNGELVLLVKSPDGQMTASLIAKHESIETLIPEQFKNIMKSKFWIVDADSFEERTFPEQVQRYIDLQASTPN